MKNGRVWLVGAGPGDPGLITVRGLEVLTHAEVVLHDALAHPALLSVCLTAELVNVGKRYGCLNPPQQLITEQLIALARAGKRVVRLKGGDPLLFARGGEEALALAEAGIAFEIVPGISSPVAASAYAGIALTHRELSSSVTFITGSDRDGVEWSPESWKRLATATDTLCILMGMRRIESLMLALIDGGRVGTTPCAVVHWGARPEQQVVMGTVSTIAERVREANVTNPSVIVVGEVVRLREKMRWFDNLPLFGRRILVPRAVEQAEATARAIRVRGAEAIVAPLIEIHEPRAPELIDAAFGKLADFDWLLFTSANGVEKFLMRLLSSGRDVRALGSLKIGVVGAKTAASLRQFGLVADRMADSFTGEDLARALLAQGGVKRVLLPRARVANEALPEMLRASGIQVEVLPVYETAPVAADKLEWLKSEFRARRVDVVLLTSASVVDSLVEALGAEAHDLLAYATLSAIGPVTLDRAREHGLNVPIVALVHTVEGLLDAVETHFSA